MILKVQTPNGWAIFGEIDHIEYSKVPNCKASDGPVGEDFDGLDYVSNMQHGIGPDTILPDIYRIEFFTNFMNEATVLLAYSPIFIMNDRGRTVEKI